MNDAIFISLPKFSENYEVKKTKIYELIKDQRLVTAKIGRRTVILNTSARAFAAAALKLGNMGNAAAENFISDQQAAGRPLCNIHSDQLTDRVSSTPEISAIVERDLLGGSFNENVGENGRG